MGGWKEVGRGPGDNKSSANRVIRWREPRRKKTAEETPSMYHGNMFPVVPAALFARLGRVIHVANI